MPKITATEGLVIGGVIAGVGYVVYKSREKAVEQKEAVTAQREELSEPVQPEGAGFIAWPMDAALRRGMEIINANIVVATKPMEHAGHVGLPTSNNWLTNVAFWMTYPETLEFPGGKLPSNFKSVPDWKKFADAWVRIFKMVKKYRAEPPPKPAPKPAPKKPPAGSQICQITHDDGRGIWAWGGGRFGGVTVYLRNLDSSTTWQAGYCSKKHRKIVPLYGEPHPQYRDEAMTLADKAIMANETYIKNDELQGFCGKHRGVPWCVESLGKNREDLGAGWRSTWQTPDGWEPAPYPTEDEPERDIQPTAKKAVASVKEWIDRLP